MSEKRTKKITWSFEETNELINEMAKDHVQKNLREWSITTRYGEKLQTLLEVITLPRNAMINGHICAGDTERKCLRRTAWDP